MKETPPLSNSLLGRWRQKFAYSFRGLILGVRGQDSFLVHIPAALAVLALAVWLQVTVVEWSLLIVCITIVFAAELFNSAIEHLARTITLETHPEIRDALDVASGAVLVTSIGAAIVGLIVLAWPVLQWLAS